MYEPGDREHFELPRIIAETTGGPCPAGDPGLNDRTVRRSGGCELIDGVCPGAGVAKRDRRLQPRASTIARLGTGASITVVIR